LSGRHNIIDTAFKKHTSGTINFPVRRHMAGRVQ